MTRHRQSPRIAPALVLAGLVGLAPGCTLYDDAYWPFGSPGTPFTLDQPVQEVSLVGKINIDPSTASKSSSANGCREGGTLFWGLARNTGDVDLDDVKVVVQAFNGAGASLGTFGGSVYSGEIVTGENGAPDSASTSLTTDQTGTFSVCTSLRFSSDLTATASFEGTPHEASTQ